MSTPTAADLETRLFLTDVAFPSGPVRVTPSGDWPITTGRENLRGAQLRRALTQPGEILARPEYGGGTPGYVEAAGDPGTRSRLAVSLRANALRDRRIANAQVAVKVGASALEVEITLQPRGADDTDTVTFDASR